MAVRLQTLKPRVATAPSGRLERAGRETASRRGYDYRWQKAREEFLRLNPLCRLCQEENRVQAATVVDHIIPHQGNERLFWDRSNWQSLCKPHHDGHKQRQEHAEGYRG